MRTITAAQAAVRAGAGRSEHVKIEIQDATATWRDMASWPGFNAIDHFEIQEDIDSPHRTATVTLKREVEDYSLAPLMDLSAANRGFDPSAAFVPFLELWREVRISVAIVPADRLPGGADWMEVFHGRIDLIDYAAEESISLQCRDLSGKLAQTWIEEERVYALAQVGGSPVELRIWRPSMVLAVGQFILPSDARRDVAGSPRFYRVTTAGTGGTTEPTWPTSGPVGDGSAIHTFEGTTSPGAGFPIEAVMQQIINAWIVGVTLLIPVPPSYAITQYLQQRQPVMEAIRTLAQQMGWDVRQKWDSGGGAYALTLYEPERTKTIADLSIGPDEFQAVQRMEEEIGSVGNAGQVIFPNSANTDPRGNALREVVQAVDAPSIATFGRIFFEIGEDQLSVIDTTAKATQLLTAALSDISTPKVQAEFTMTQGFPWTELGDLYAWQSDGRHFTGEQKLAVVSHSLAGDAGSFKTSIACRGKPASANKGWHLWTGRNSPGLVHSTTVFESAIGIELTAAEVVGGTQLAFDGPPDKRAHGAEYEVHLSDAPAFTPSASTLVTLTKSTQVTLADLIPGKAYFSQVVPTIRNGMKLQRAQPSVELAFTAGRGGAGHLKQEVEWGRLPLNGGFETWSETAAAPDQWIGQGKNFGIDWTRGVGAGGVSGAQYLIHAHNAVSFGRLESIDFLPVTAGETYRGSWWVKFVSGASSSGERLEIRWYDWTQSIISGGVLDFAPNTLPAGVWVHRHGLPITAPATAKFAKIRLGQDLLGVNVFHVDEVRLQAVEPVAIQAIASTTVAQSIPYATPAIIDFATVDYDPTIAITTGAAWKFTAARAGRYRLSSTVTVNMATTVWSLMELWVYVNGTAKWLLNRVHIDTANGSFGPNGLSGSAVVNLAAGQYLDIRLAQQNAPGTARTLANTAGQNHVAIERLSDVSE